MPTPQGTRRSPYCQRLTLLGPTPNSWATRCCVMPSAPSISQSSLAAAGRKPDGQDMDIERHQEEQRARLA